MTSEFRASSEKSGMRIFGNRGGFNTMGVLLVVVIGLIVVISGFEAYKLLGPKAPPRSELLRAANGLMTAVGAIREQVEANADFRETDKLFSTPQTGTITMKEFNYVVGRMTGRADTRTYGIQQALKAYQAVWDADSRKIGDSIEAMGKEYTGGGKDARALLAAAKTFSGICQDFSDYALHPIRENGLHTYVGQYRVKRANVLKGYKLYIGALKGWDVSERPAQHEAWKKELRIADENLAKF